MKSIILALVFIFCNLIVTISLGEYVRDPVGLEFKHGINQYLNGKGMLVKSLNTELDTIYIYGLHDNSLAGKDKTYNPRFMGSIILFSMYSGITGDDKYIYLMLSILMFSMCASIFLIFKNNKLIKKQKNALILTICGGLPFYMLLSGKVDDLQISYFLFFAGHYFTTRKNTKIYYLGHFFMSMAGGFYRFEFMVLYALHWIIIGFKRKFSYLVGILFSVALILSLNYQYKGELGINRDQFSYWNNIHQNEIKENVFKNEQIKLEQEYNDYTAQEFSEGIEADTNKTGFFGVAIRYFRLNKDGLEKRITHTKNLLFGLGYITLFILIGWVSLLEKRKFKIYKETYLLISTILGFTLLIYYSFYNPWERIGEPRFIQSSYIRYSLGLIYIFGAIGIFQLIYKNRRILAILILFLCILEPIKFISFGATYPYYQVADKFKKAAIIYDKKNIENGAKEVVWVADDDVKQAVFLYNANVFSYQAVPANLLEEELSRIISRANERGISVVFSAMYESKITEKMKEILVNKFSSPLKIDGFNFYKAN